VLFAGETMPEISDGKIRIQRVFREAARFPIVVFVIVTSSVLAWLGIWWVWRLGQMLFKKYLERPWI
jgi:hypothetical protein